MFSANKIESSGEREAIYIFLTNSFDTRFLKRPSMVIYVHQIAPTVFAALLYTTTTIFYWTLSSAFTES